MEVEDAGREKQSSDGVVRYPDSDLMRQQVKPLHCKTWFVCRRSEFDADETPPGVAGFRGGCEIKNTKMFRQPQQTEISFAERY